MRSLLSILLAAFVLAVAAPAQQGPELDQAFEALRNYQVGQSRKPLMAIEDEVHSVKAGEEARILEWRLARTLSTDATDDGKEFYLPARRNIALGDGVLIPASNVFWYVDGVEQYTQLMAESSVHTYSLLVSELIRDDLGLARIGDRIFFVARDQLGENVLWSITGE